MDEAPIDISAISAADLVARLKDPRDPEDQESAMALAWRRVFASQIGRLVLADIMHMARLGVAAGPSLAPDARAWTDGQQALALEILKTAGFGPEAVAVNLLMDNLEGQEHDGRSGSGLGEPEPEFGD